MSYGTRFASEARKLLALSLSLATAVALIRLADDVFLGLYGEPADSSVRARGVYLVALFALSVLLVSFVEDPQHEPEYPDE